MQQSQKNPPAEKVDVRKSKLAKKKKQVIRTQKKKEKLKFQNLTAGSCCALDNNASVTA
jgi:hypothetical protein